MTKKSTSTAKSKTSKAKPTKDSGKKKTHPLMGTLIDCPNHMGHQITIQADEVKLFARDTCQVRNNMWTNKVVWEKALNPDELVEVVEVVEPEQPENNEQGES